MVSARVQSAGAQSQTQRLLMEALLFEPMMRPLQAAFGEYGDIAGQLFAQELGRMLERGHE